MFSRLSRPAAYFGPLILFALALAGILYLRPAPPRVSIPQLPCWNFSAPAALEQENVRSEGTDYNHIRDPFSRKADLLALAASSVPEPELNMVITGGPRPCCMINRKLYHPGERALGFTVKAIGTTWVDIIMDNGTITRLFLKKQAGP